MSHHQSSPTITMKRQKSPALVQTTLFEKSAVAAAAGNRAQGGGGVGGERRSIIPISERCLNATCNRERRFHKGGTPGFCQMHGGYPSCSRLGCNHYATTHVSEFPFCTNHNPKMQPRRVGGDTGDSAASSIMSRFLKKTPSSTAAAAVAAGSVSSSNDDDVAMRLCD